MLTFLLLAFADNSIPATEPLRSINTSIFEIVYPASAEKLAQRSAAALEIMVQEIYKNRRVTSIPKLHLTLNHMTPTASADVDLFPLSGRVQGTLSNNHPFRKGHASSWLETSMFDLAWESAQYERSFFGGSILYWLFLGDYAWDITHKYAQPQWFLDGETRYYSQLWMGSAASMPRQQSRLAAYLEAESRPSFHQLTIGSNKRFLPKKEETGQLMVNYGIQTYSDNLWNIVVPYAVSNWYGVHSFETSLLRYGPTTIDSLFSGSTGDLKRSWNKNRKLRRESNLASLIPPSEDRVHHHYPRRSMDGSLYFLQDGLTDTGSIAVQRGPFEPPQKVVVLGSRSDLHFDEHGGYLIWTEQIRDKMWYNKASQDLILYDSVQKKRYRLTEKQTLYNPIFSSDGEHIAVFSMHQDGSIHLEQRKNNGDLEQSTPLPAGDHFDLSWEKELCWVHKSIDYGNRVLCTKDVETTPTTRYDWTWISISDPILFNDHLYFVSSLPTGEELHTWDGQQQYRAAASAYGIMHPFIDKENKKILLVEYQDAGQSLVQIPLLRKLWTPISPRQEEHPKPPEYIPYQSYPYGRWNGLFRIHSWSPSYNATYGIYQLGAQTTNVRDSLSAQVRASWDSINDSVAYGLSTTYKEFWPEITAELEMGEKSKIITPGIFGLGEAVGISWKTQRYGGTLTLPLFHQHGPFQGDSRFYFSVHQENNEDHKLNTLTLSPDDVGIPTDSQTQLRLGIQSNLVQDQAHSHLAPPLGYQAKAEYQQILDGSAGFFVKGKVWLPSLFPTHSISAQAGYTDLPFHEESHTLIPIGTTNRLFNSLSYLDVRYTLPIANPDFAMDGWVYFRRVRGSVFFERSLRNDTSISAIGVSIDVDTHILRYTLPLTRFGIDIAYHQQRKQLLVQPKITLYEF